MKDQGAVAIHIRVAGGLARRLAASLVPRVFPVVLLLAALGGCAHTQSFRVVDAQTGEPLGDVWVRQGGSRSSAYTLKTDTAGSVQFQKSASQYSLTKPGYEEARVEVKGAVARVRSASDPKGLEVKRYGDMVQVSLRRQNAAVGTNGPTQQDPVTMSIIGTRPDNRGGGSGPVAAGTR
jgi:hypothetical protein